jgi:hypothetical protein
MVVHTCHTGFWGSINRSIIVQAIPSINGRPYLKNAYSKNVLEAWLTRYSVCLARTKPSLNHNTVRRKRQVLVLFFFLHMTWM